MGIIKEFPRRHVKRMGIEKMRGNMTPLSISTHTVADDLFLMKIV